MLLISLFVKIPLCVSRTRSSVLPWVLLPTLTPVVLYTHHHTLVLDLRPLAWSARVSVSYPRSLSFSSLGGREGRVHRQEDWPARCWTGQVQRSDEEDERWAFQGIITRHVSLCCCCCCCYEGDSADDVLFLFVLFTWCRIWWSRRPWEFWNKRECESSTAKSSQNF